jgi:chitinase
VAYHDSSAGNTAAKYRNDDVDIEETPGGGHDVGYVEAGEWLEYSVSVSNAGPYRVELRTAAPQEGVTLHLELDGQDVSGPIVLPATADWNVFTTFSVEGVKLGSGGHVLRVSFDKLGCNIDWLRFTAM